MNEIPHTPEPGLPPEEDPLLTAYALDALPPEERAQVEARLAWDHDARAFVEEMRGLSAQLSQEMAEEAEEDFGLSTEQRRELRRAIAKRLPTRMKFPRIAVICAVVAILLTMMLVMLWVAMQGRR